jgi:hypothetical protein
MKITDFVYDKNFCQFVYYRQNLLYYSVVKKNTSEKYLFPIPLDDLGDATINNIEKSIFLMRYMRKALDEGTLVRYN